MTNKKISFKEQIQQRLQILKAEFESGQNVLADLETKQASVSKTLLRISGAIQVLEEELAKAEENDEQLPIEVETLPITESHES